MMYRLVLLIMTVFISLMMSVAAYSLVYYLLMPMNEQTKNLSFFVTSEVETKLQSDNKVKTIPSLKSLVQISNPIYGLSQQPLHYDEI
jgi:glycine cleavage system H lipoate-binding protein